jgi:hypothetical protein
MPGAEISYIGFLTGLCAKVTVIQDMALGIIVIRTALGDCGELQSEEKRCGILLFSTSAARIAADGSCMGARQRF